MTHYHTFTHTIPLAFTEDDDMLVSKPRKRPIVDEIYSQQNLFLNIQCAISVWSDNNIMSAPVPIVPSHKTIDEEIWQHLLH
jgi:hypothetical protein